MFPHIIDSTMLSTLRSCPQKFFYKYVECYNVPEDSPDLHAGKCLATALEAARKAYFAGGDKEQCENLAIEVLNQTWGDPTLYADNNKNLMKMEGALRYYLKEFPLDHEDYVTHAINGKPCVEMGFKAPLGINTPDGTPIQFVGTLDLICQHAGGLWMLDEKTTGSSLSYNWGDQWVRRGQFIGYAWGIQQEYGIELDGAIVSGLAIQKTQYAHKLKLIHITPHMMLQWMNDTLATLTDAMNQYRQGYWRKSFGEHCAAYGRPCEYMKVCNSPYPDRALSQYQRIRWNPIKREQEVIA